MDSRGYERGGNGGARGGGGARASALGSIAEGEREGESSPGTGGGGGGGVATNLESDFDRERVATPPNLERPHTSDSALEEQRRRQRAIALELRASGAAGNLGQNAMQQGDVERVQWDEIHADQRRVRKMISKVAQQGAESCAQLTVKFGDKYIPVFVNLKLDFRQTINTRFGGGEEKRRSVDDDDAWPLDAYSMVFTDKMDALAWYDWHAHKGDPCHPALAAPAAEHYQLEEKHLESEMDYLAAIRCRIVRALILQESFGRIAHLTACLMGYPMATQVLQDDNNMLSHIICLADAPEELLVKIDTRRARAALRDYVDDAAKVLTSPAMSYQIGANRVMRKKLVDIKALDAQTKGMMDVEGMRMLEEVNTWMTVSETCTSKSLYRIITEQDEKVGAKKAEAAARRERRHREKEHRMTQIEAHKKRASSRHQEENVRHLI